MNFPTKPTAKDFADPLLKALATLSGFSLNPVPLSDAYEPVLKLTGVTREQFGKAQGTETPQTERWIQFAFANLVKANLASKKGGRGKWALTQEGIEKARELIGATTPTPVPQNDSEEGLSIPISPGNDEEIYYPDPYIRSLAIRNTRCFPGYSSRAPVCARCPLQGPCKNAVSGQLSALAGVLSQEDIKAEAAAKAKAAADARKKNQPVPASPAVPMIMDSFMVMPRGNLTAHSDGTRMCRPKPPGVFMPRSWLVTITASFSLNAPESHRTTVPTASIPGVWG